MKLNNRIMMAIFSSVFLHRKDLVRHVAARAHEIIENKNIGPQVSGDFRSKITALYQSF